MTRVFRPRILWLSGDAAFFTVPPMPAITLVFALGLTGLFFLPALAIAPWARWRPSVGMWLTRWAAKWSRAVLWVCRVRVETEGFDQALPEPAYLVLCNHTSHFDALAVYAHFPRDLCPVAKRELGRVPIFGWVLASGAAVMIDRGDGKKAKTSLDRAGEVIRQGRSVLMFPEGTRTAGSQMLPFKKGPFHLAQAAQVPILPVTVEGASDVLKPKDWRIRPGTIRMKLGAPMSIASFPPTREGRAAMAQTVRKAMETMLKGTDSA